MTVAVPVARDPSATKRKDHCYPCLHKASACLHAQMSGTPVNGDQHYTQQLLFFASLAHDTYCMATEHRPQSLRRKDSATELHSAGFGDMSSSRTMAPHAEIIEISSDDEVGEGSDGGSASAAVSSDADADFIEPDVVDVDDDVLSDDDDIVVLTHAVTLQTPRLRLPGRPHRPSRLRHVEGGGSEGDLGNERRRRRDQRSPADDGSRTRRRIADEDVEVLDVRPAASRLTPQVEDAPTHFTRSEAELYRRHLLDRLQNGRLETPFGSVRSRHHDHLFEELNRLDASARERQMQDHINSTIMTRGRLRNSPLTFLQEILGQLYDRGVPDQGDEIEASILARIERDNEHRLDHRLQSENIYNKRTLQDKTEVAMHELKGYTNNIEPGTDTCCELCGVVLGVGIPESFSPDPRYDERISEYQTEYKSLAPWFCFKQCTQVDVELSKRVFAAKCGHVYCGRCFKNIGSRPPLRRKRNETSIENPRVYAPRACVADECGTNFRGKHPFAEVFF